MKTRASSWGEILESQGRHVPGNGASLQRVKEKQFFFFFGFWQVVVAQAMVPIRTYGGTNDYLPPYIVSQI